MKTLSLLAARCREISSSRSFVVFLIGGGFVASSFAADPRQADHWTGAIRCEINVTADGYAHQETQIWTLANSAPAVRGAYETCDATWSVTGQGWHDRTGQTARRVGRWTANVAGSPAPVAFFRPAPGKLVVQLRHAQSRAGDGYTGTEQYINLAGASRPERPLVQTLYEWTSWKIEPRSDAETQLTGSQTSKVSAGIAPMHPGDAQVTITLTWALGRGSAPAMPPSTLPPLAPAPGERTEEKQPPGRDRTGRAPASGEPAADVSTPVARLLSFSPDSGGVGLVTAVQLTGENTHWQAGVTAADFGAGITVTHTQVNSPTGATAWLNVDAAAALGSRMVTVTSGSEVVTTREPAFTVRQPIPAITPVEPTSKEQGFQGLSVIVRGEFTHFAAGSTTVSFGQGITIASLTVHTATGLTAILNIAPDAPVGARTITVTTCSEVATLSNGFTVTPATSPPPQGAERPPAPQLLSIDPAVVQQGANEVQVRLLAQGTHWRRETTTVDFGPDIRVADILVNSPTDMVAIIQVSSSAAPGPRAVRLTTPVSGVIPEVVGLPDRFSVEAVLILVPGSIILPVLMPTITQVSPNSGSPSAPALQIAITGRATRFVQGTTTANFGGGLTVSSLTVTSPTSATATLTIDRAAAAGPRTVSITTGNEIATLANGFSVMLPPPAPGSTGPAPTSGNYRIILNGFRVNSRTFEGAENDGAGDEIVGAARVQVAKRDLSSWSTTSVKTAVHGCIGANWPGRVRGGSADQFGGFVPGDVFPTGQDPARFTGNTIPRTFPLLLWEGTLSNGGDVVVIKPALWEVDGDDCVLRRWADKPHLVLDEGYLASAREGRLRVMRERIAQAELSTVPDVDVRIECTNAYDTGPCPCDPGTDRPIGIRGYGDLSSGGAFNGPTIVCSREGIERSLTTAPPPGGLPQGIIALRFIEGGGPGWGGDYELFLRVERVGGAATPPPGGRTAPAEVDVTPVRPPERAGVPEPPPAAITEVTPNSAPQWTENLTITFTARGTNFTQSAAPTVDLGPEIRSVGQYFYVESPTRVLGSFTIAGDAAPGPRTVTIRSGNQVLTLPDGFTVTPRASRDVFRLTPESGQQGQQNLTVDISTFQWRYFVLGATADFGPGITVASFEVRGEFAARAVLNIDPGAAPGPRTVTVRLPGGRVDAFNDVFTVTAAPLVRINPGNRIGTIDSVPSISLSPNNAVRGSTNVYVMITGNRTNFVHTVTAVDFGPGVAVQFVEVPEAPLLAKAVVNIAPNATPGKRTVTVTTGNEVVTLPDGFLVKGAATPPQAANDQFSVRRDRKLVAGAVRLNTFDGLAGNVDEDDRFARAGSRVFFSGRKGAENGLWASDGTPAGTRFVTAVQQPQNLTGVGHRVFFTAHSAGVGEELWTSDGTASGTALVRDVAPGPDSSSFLRLDDAGGMLYFVIAAAGAQQLWRSDGTAAGTVPVKTNISMSSGQHMLLSHAGASVFFVANERTPGSSVVERWLWKSDGTAAGTVKLCEMMVGNSGAARESAKPIRGVGNQLFLLGNPPGSAQIGGPDLWRSDGTTQGTIKVLDVNPNPTTDVRSVIDLVAVNNALFFTVLDCSPSPTWEVWRSDGTPNGTVLVKAGISAGNYDAKFPTAIDGNLYFSGSAGGGATYGVWKSDGTAAGTTLVKAIDLPSVAWHLPAPQPIVGAGGAVFFHGNGQLWKSDGTTAGTLLVSPSTPYSLTESDGALLYCAPWNTLWTAGAAVSLIVNDTGPTGVPLKVALVTGPAHGTLTLGEDGGFIYRPNAGYTGTDQFTYTATDGADVSNPAAVTIQVVAQ